MNHSTIIQRRAEAHHQRYKSFDLGRFLRWIERQIPGWQEWAVGQSISTLNQRRRYQQWEAIRNVRRVQYTKMPAEDGPR